MFGDFNINILSYNSSKEATEYIDLLFSYGFLQLVTKPTRYAAQSATLIDHVISNVPNSEHCVSILTSRLSDHFPIFYSPKTPRLIPEPKMLSYRDFSESNINLFKNALNSISWDILRTNIEMQPSYDYFAETFFDLYNLYFPMISKKFNKNVHPLHPWMSKGLLISGTTKASLCTRSIKIPTPENIFAYKQYRNLYAALLREAKKLYYRNKLQKYQTDLKKTWETIQMAIKVKRRDKSGISSLTVSGTTYHTPAQIATKFNEFFSQAAKNIVSDIHPTPHTYKSVRDPSLTKFNLDINQLTETEVLEAIAQLKSKSSTDFEGLSSSFIKKIASSISLPLTYLFRKSFESGHVPDQLKVAKIIPIFKSGDVSSPDNYRPIALLSTFSKILEKIMCNRLTQHLEVNGLLSDFQFGFRKNHSTLHPLLLFSNKITEVLENKKHAIAIFCDLRKAFDTVDHAILFEKLKDVGVSGIELQWFKSYLSNRKQFTFIEDTKSGLININIGVPQGSILGPLLFLIYINDLPLCSEFLSLLFADDTTLILSHENFDTPVEQVNAELKKIAFYFRLNKLALHPSKTKFMIFSNSPAVKNATPILCLDNNNDNENNVDLRVMLGQVSPSTEEKVIRFLGVLIDPNLSYSFHIKNITARLSRSLFLIRSAKNFLDEKSLKSVYYSTFHCHLVYCLPIWSSASNSLLHPVEILQKKAIRLISNAKYNAHTEPLFKNCKILPIDKLIEFFNLQIMQRYLQGFLPKAFISTWITNADRRQELSNNEDLVRILRNDDNIYVPFARLSFSLKQPLINVPKTWTEFNEPEIKILRNKIEFNQKLKKHLISLLSTTVNCSRILCPACHLPV